MWIFAGHLTSYAEIFTRICSAVNFRVWMCDLPSKVVSHLFENIRVFILKSGKEFL